MASPWGDVDRDASFSKLMHGKSAKQRNAFMSMLNKDGGAHRLVTDDYLKHWEEDASVGDKAAEEARDGRKEKYMPLVNKQVILTHHSRTSNLIISDHLVFMTS